jgi:hypothetical protein
MYNYRQPYYLCLSVSLSLCRFFSKCLSALVPSLSLCLFVPLSLFPPIAQAQTVTKYLYLDNISNDYINYLINSGQVSPDFVFLQPYDSRVWDKTENNPEPAEYFKGYWQYYYGKGSVSGQLQLNDEGRYHDALYNRYQASGSVHLAVGLVTLANRTGMNQDFKHDPYYAGDLSESENWLYGRTNDAYIDMHFSGFQVFFGRMNRNWGPPGSYSLILSNYPYSYDHFLFSYTYKKIKLSLLAAQLDDLNSFEKTGGPDTISMIRAAKRYLVGHRLDLAISPKFQVALTEMATFGGDQEQFDWAFLNPLTLYYGLQRNDKKQLNGFWNIDLFYKPWPQVSLYNQFLIDDIIVNNDPGVNDRARYPDRLAVQSSLSLADLLTRGSAVDITYVRVWNRTYQSGRTYENYHYRQLGLGYPCASCEEIKLNLNYWGWFPWYFKNETVVGRYGDVTVTDLFHAVKENFPVPPVTRNLINRLEVHYFFSRQLTFYTQFKYSAAENHYLNRIDNLQGFSFMLGAQILLSAGIDL